MAVEFTVADPTFYSNVPQMKYGNTSSDCTIYSTIPYILQ